MKKPDKLALFTYLSLFYELFEDAEPVELDPPMPVETRELSPLREEGPEDQFLTSGEVGSSPEKSLTNSLKKKKKSRKRVTRRQTKKSLATSPASVERYGGAACACFYLRSVGLQSLVRKISFSDLSIHCWTPAGNGVQ